MMKGKMCVLHETLPLWKNQENSGVRSHPPRDWSYENSEALDSIYQGKVEARPLAADKAFFCSLHLPIKPNAPN
jgi:hypothetical protein